MTAPIQTRMDVTVKLDQRPSHCDIEDKRVTFAVACGELTLTVIMKAKAWRKFVAATEATPNWSARLAGKLGKRTPDGSFLLNEASFQVFDRTPKPKDADPHAPPPDKPRAPAAPAPTVQAPAKPVHATAKRKKRKEPIVQVYRAPGWGS